MIEFGSDWWLLIPCAALALAASVVAYRYSAFRPAMPWRFALPALRFASLMVCLALLLQPRWRHSSQQEVPPVLAVLADESLSTAPYDSLLRATLAALPAVEADVKLYGFSGQVRALSNKDSLQQDGVRTNIAEALTSVHTLLANEHLQGILLLTDGQYNTGRNPRYVAALSPVPIHAMAIGDTLEQRDVKIQSVVTNEIGYQGMEIPVEVSVMSKGYEGQQISVTASRAGRVLSTVRTRLGPDNTVLPVELRYVPQTPGLIQITFTVTRLEGETTYANNTAAVTVNILDRRKHMLLIAAAPHPDFASIRNLLRSNKDLVVETRVQKDRQEFYEGPLPDSLAAFDVIILHGFPGPNANPALTEQIAASRARLLFVLTEQTDMALLRSLFDQALPAIPAEERSLYAEAAFELTPEGRRHAALQGLPPIAAEQLPPLKFNAANWQVSPDAIVLAQARVAGVNIEKPLLVARSRGGLRTTALLGSGVWRWHNLPGDLSSSETWWPSLFDNLVQWLLAPEDDRLVRITPAYPSFGDGESVQFTGQIYDESLNVVDAAEVHVDVTAPDGTRYPYTLSGIGSGRYVADIGTLPEGFYSYQARAVRDGIELGSDAGSFTVGTAELEYAETRANTQLLRQIADQSGGQYLPAGDMQQLASVLRIDSAFAAKAVRSTRERALWQWPLILAIVLGLLTTEWILRKRIGMT